MSRKALSLMGTARAARQTTMRIKPKLLGAFIGAIFALSGCERESGRSAKLSADCSDAGMRSFDRLKAEIGERLSSTTLVPPKFHFNKQLNACLMQVEYFSVLGGTRKVIDVYENKALLETGDAPGPNGTEIIGDQDSYVRFDERARKLMTQ